VEKIIYNSQNFVKQTQKQMTQKRKNRTTILDIARIAGVSPATVSRILNNTAIVAPEKERAVRQAIKESNYQPNTTAQDLVWGTTSTIGILTQHLGSPFYGEMLHGIETGLRGSRYVPLFVSSQWDLSKDLTALDVLIRRQVDALIIVAGELPEQKLLEVSTKFPMVILGRYIEDLKDHCVYISSFEGAYNATRYLIEMGHTAILHITGNLNHHDALERRDGYLQAMQDAGLDVPAHFIVEGDYAEPAALAQTERFLAAHGCIFTALFAANDQTAAGARLALYRRGIRVPEDVSLIGFDDLPGSSYMTPPLTTIRQPAFQMGEEASRLALRLLNGKRGEEKKLPFELMVRESVAKK
jgi:LacI family transcriptional regulator